MLGKHNNEKENISEVCNSIENNAKGKLHNQNVKNIP
jgi:hypothetical protein